ncbi:MAG: isoamylase early set domain-containing protein [Gemmatimonadaceae bacterium]|nr:isoamylase early set domain-containing protein [Gemmatimonadaceae bacterium]
MADHDLPFPSDDDLEVAPILAAAIESRLRTSYAAMAPTSAETIAFATQSVLTAADTAATRRFPRPQWWWGAAAAAVLVVTVARPWRPGESQRHADSVFTGAIGAAQPVGVTREESDGAIRFDLTLPESAREVSLVGDFNGWDENATPMIRRSADGTWSARVPLSPGRHTYAFVVDGQQWLVDPLAPQVPDAGFGPTNAVIVEGTSP